MTYFVITYDLIKKDETEYEELWDELENLQAVRYQKSCWIVESSLTAFQLKELLKMYIEDNDRLMIVPFDQKPQWTRAMRGTKAWMDARFP